LCAHNISPDTYYNTDSDYQDEYVLLQAPLNVPVGISRVEVQVVVSSVGLQRILHSFVFSHVANVCRQNILRLLQFSSEKVVLSLPSEQVAFPFNVFW